MNIYISESDDAIALRELKAILLGINDIGYVMTHPHGATTALGKAAEALYDEIDRLQLLTHPFKN